MNLSHACIGCLIALVTGCQTMKSHFNVALRPEPDQKLIAKNLRVVPTPAPGATAAALQPGESTGQSIAAAPVEPFRASFNVNGRRGNDKVLFFLALSGGGSRAAYLSATTMLRLQTLHPDVDLLNEVDVVSSVSGGSLAAAYYVGSRDDKLDLTGPLAPLAQWAAAMPERVPKLQVDAKLSSARCSGPLDAVEQEQIRTLFNVADAAAQRVIDFCQQAQLQLPVWDEATVHKHMTRNYLVRWFIRWFRPDNLGFYWLTAWDRSDIMAQTFGNTLFASPAFLGGELQFRDLNPQRPFLIMNATNATEQASEDINIPSAERQREQQDNFAFGSVFTFTEEDFRDRLYSDLRAFPLARGVMASSAFPVVFPSMTLRDFRPTRAPACQREDARNNDDCFRYVHVFDGGNSDNLGLRSIKRALLELERSGQLGGYGKVIVLLVDAFTKPRGTSRTAADPRSTVSYLLDTNVVDAVDSLLLTNRDRLVREFESRVLQAGAGECSPAGANLPRSLCDWVDENLPARELDLRDNGQLLFCHLGFHGIADVELKRKLDHIPTSFKIEDEDARAIDTAVKALLREDPCIEAIYQAVRPKAVQPAAQAAMLPR